VRLARSVIRASRQPKTSRKISCGQFFPSLVAEPIARAATCLDRLPRTRPTRTGWP
jgi:hypothetical protein